MSTRAVFLHVGAPKSGTTYLQARLAGNARSLARHGLHVPTFSRLTPRPQAHFMAALDLLGQDWGGPPGHAVGAWPRLVRAAERVGGTVVVSHEILAPAPPTAVRRALDDLGREGHDVHVVYTARDVGSALTSAWQESVKQGRRWTFRRFLDLASTRRGWWSRALDLPAVLHAWSAELPASRVHLVTVPHNRSGADTLWDRFCAALGADPAWGPREPRTANTSLGVVEAQLLRRLNDATGRERADDLRAARVTRLLEAGGLAQRRSAGLSLPPDRHAWAVAEAERWAAWLAEHPLTLHGTPADLVPAPAAAEWQDPDLVPEEVLLSRALEVAASLERPGASAATLAGRRARRAAGLLLGNG